MNIVLLIILTVAITIISIIYVGMIFIDEQKKTIKNILKFFLKEKKYGIYILIMLITLCVFAIYLPSIYKTNTLINNMKLIILLGILFVCGLVDYKKYIIPNHIILFGLLARVVLCFGEILIDMNSFWVILKGDLAAILVVIVFFIIGVLIVKNGIGMGDIKLIFIMCIYQGFYGVISSLLCSMFTAFVLSIILLISRKKTKKDTIPFAPSVLVGTMVSVFLTGM